MKNESNPYSGNLEDQLQKHETLVAEINANKKRLDDLESRGQELVNEDHYAAPEIAGIQLNFGLELGDCQSR